MSRPEPANEALRAILKSQFHAALAMLRQAIEKCPDDLWVDASHPNPYWRVAYHTLYFAHSYLQPHLDDFTPWDRHQTYIQYLDNEPPPPEFGDIGELPGKPPQTGEPYTKAELLEYWDLCDGMVDRTIDASDLDSPECGFFWYHVSKLEHELVSLRHIQHHTAQLADRLRGVANVGVDWVGSRRAN